MKNKRRKVPVWFLLLFLCLSKVQRFQHVPMGALINAIECQQLPFDAPPENSLENTGSLMHSLSKQLFRQKAAINYCIGCPLNASTSPSSIQSAQPLKCFFPQGILHIKAIWMNLYRANRNKKSLNVRIVPSHITLLYGFLQQLLLFNLRQGRMSLSIAWRCSVRAKNTTKRGSEFVPMRMMQ